MTAYLVMILTLVAIAGVAALALNLQWGLCGMVNFGLAGFYALGAYACALAALNGVWPVMAMLVAAVVAAGFAALVALLSARLSDDFLAITTLGFAEIVHLVALHESWLTRGSLGLPGVPRPGLSFVGAADYPVFFMIFAWVVLLLVFVILEVLARSPFGRTIRAVREDDTVAEALGKNVLWVRVRAFAIGGAALGIAGSLHAFHYTYINPEQFTPIVTAYAFMAVIIGGRGSNRGLLIGVVSVMVLIEGSRFLKELIPVLDSVQIAALRLILIGLGLVLLLIFRPQGIMAEHRLRIQPQPLEEPDHGTRERDQGGGASARP